MTVIFIIGVLLFAGGVVLINLARSPPAANIGMCLAGVGLVLMVLAGGIDMAVKSTGLWK